MGAFHRHGKRGSSLLERTVAGLHHGLQSIVLSDGVAARHGLLQSLDPRAKLIGALLLIAAAIASRNLLIVATLAFGGALLAWLSRLPIRPLFTTAWVGVFLFTGVMAFPALFLTPGEPWIRSPTTGWTITLPGLRTAGFLLARGEATATLSLLLVLSTPWNQILKSLRTLGAPPVLVALLGLTFRYIFLFLQTAVELFEARRSRIVSRLGWREQASLVTATIGVLLNKTFAMSQSVYLAMQSRGYRGDVFLLDDFTLRRRDWAALTGCVILCALFIWKGR